MSEDPVLFNVEGPLAIITINRPGQRNALNQAMGAGLFAAFERFETDVALRVAILTGAGDRDFCVGGDLKEMAELKMTVPPRGFVPMVGDNVQLTKPLIGAVNGFALGGGFMLAQNTDLCIASTAARFAVTEAKVGRGSAWTVPLLHKIPERVMMEMLLTGRPITAERAYEIGLVNHVVEPAALMAKAREMAQDIVENAPLSVLAVKEVVRLSTEMGRSAALSASRHVLDRVYRSRDAQEGIAAVLEKRKPVWTGE